VDGLTLRPGCESFVGAGAMPMRHGLTLGELARWFVATLRLDVDCQIIPMEGWTPEATPGYGWPLGTRTWGNPSPNAPNLWMARCYPGSVMLEGTTLSEGRGTTRPLELLGAPDVDARALLAEMRALAPASPPTTPWHRHPGRRGAPTGASFRDLRTASSPPTSRTRDNSAPSTGWERSGSD